MDFVERPLFGGAIICRLPSSFSDASLFRDVPDHQEVWVDGGPDRSLVIEILERKEDVLDDEAVPFFLSDLAACNDAQSPMVLKSRPALVEEELPELPAGVPCLLGVGEQTV